MRLLRTITGLALVIGGLPMVIGAFAGWFAMQHRDAGGGFTASLAPIRTDGSALVIPDVEAVMRDHGAGRWIGSGRLTVAVGSERGPLRVVLAPASAAANRLADVSRTEIVQVGFTDGPQPVLLADLAGTASTLPSLPESWRQAGLPQTLDVMLPAADPMALIVLRPDGEPGIDATVTVTFVPGWLNAATWGLLLAGTIAVLTGGALLLQVGNREVVVVVEAERMAEFADRISQRIGTRGGIGQWDDARWNEGRWDATEPLSQRTGESPYVHTAT